MSPLFDLPRKARRRLAISTMQQKTNRKPPKKGGYLCKLHGGDGEIELASEEEDTMSLRGLSFLDVSMIE